MGKILSALLIKEVYHLDNKKVYQQWNGKNINGDVESNNNVLSTEAKKSTTADMKCTVGVDTFSGNELLEDTGY